MDEWPAIGNDFNLFNNLGSFGVKPLTKHTNDRKVLDLVFTAITNQAKSRNLDFAQTIILFLFNPLKCTFCVHNRKYFL